MKTVKILTFLFFFASSSLAIAQEAPKVITLQKDQIAPFAGTLLNPAAVAHAIAEKENVVRQCNLSTQYIEKREKAKCDLLVGTAKVQVDALSSQYNSIMEIKDEEIKRLSKFAFERPNKHNHWWFAGGVVVGIATSIAIFYAAVEVSN